MNWRTRNHTSSHWLWDSPKLEWTTYAHCAQHVVCQGPQGCPLGSWETSSNATWQGSEVTQSVHSWVGRPKYGPTSWLSTQFCLWAMAMWAASGLRLLLLDSLVCWPAFVSRAVQLTTLRLCRRPANRLCHSWLLLAGTAVPSWDAHVLWSHFEAGMSKDYPRSSPSRLPVSPFFLQMRGSSIFVSLDPASHWSVHRPGKRSLPYSQTRTLAIRQQIGRTWLGAWLETWFVCLVSRPHGAS